MKTKRNIYHVGGGSSFLLMTILLWMAGTMNVQATDYELWVGGKQVKSSNENGVTGGGIVEGTVTYNATKKVLTLRDVTINCNGNNKDKQGIYNQGIVGLVIECYGNCRINSFNNVGLECGKETYVNIQSGTTWIESDNSNAVAINGPSCRFASWTSSTKLYITSYSGVAVQGTGTLTKVTFAGKNIEIDGPKGDLVTFDKVYFDGEFYSNGSVITTGCEVKLLGDDSDPDYNYPRVKNVNNMPYIVKADYTPSNKTGRTPIVTSPKNADFNSSKKSICDGSGNIIYKSDIVINEEFAVVVNARYFPDANFRSFMNNKYGSFITQSQIDNCTEIDVGYKNIADLDGIKYFTKLKTLRCPYNQLTVLNLSYNTYLTKVECDYNQLTSLTVPASNLQLLGCSNNKLTSCLTNNTHTYLKELYCSNNSSMTSLGVGFNYLPALEKFECSGTKFSNMSLNSCTKLKELTCENMTALTSLTCNNTALTTLSLSGCSVLNTLNLYNNKLTYLNVYGCKALQTLNCRNNQLTSIANLFHEAGCKLALDYLQISSNKFTSLDLSALSKLKTLYCDNVTTLTSLTCTGTALTTLTVNGCSNLKTLNCYNNNLTTLNMDACTSLQKLDCKNNYSLSSIGNMQSIRPTLQELNVKSCNFTSLGLTGATNLKYLNCSDNQLNLLNLSGLSSLQNLECSNNSSLTSLDLSASAFPNLSEVNCSYCDIRNINWYDLKLSKLDCSYNANLKTLNNARDYFNQTKPLTTLNVNGCSALTEINVSCNALSSINLISCSNLSKLLCDHNSLTSLNLSGKTKLTALDCSSNNIESLNLNSCSNIQELYCSSNNISSLNVKNLSYLTSVQCISNRLTSLDLTGCNALTNLYCNDNQITSLILPYNSDLSTISCFNNNLAGNNMDAFVTTLPDRTNKSTGYLSVVAELNEYNVFTWKNVRDAQRKNWDVLIRNADGTISSYTGDVPTNIRTAETDIDDNAPRYNLGGQRVSRDYKGVVIVNGKKVFSK